MKTSTVKPLFIYEDEQFFKEVAIAIDGILDRALADPRRISYDHVGNAGITLTDQEFRLLDLLDKIREKIALRRFV